MPTSSGALDASGLSAPACLQSIHTLRKKIRERSVRFSVQRHAARDSAIARRWSLLVTIVRSTANVLIALDLRSSALRKELRFISRMLDGDASQKLITGIRAH
jgi:hypothetical protein